MQFVVHGHFNERFASLSQEQQHQGSQAEWSKSREYYAAGYLRQVWVVDTDQGIISLFEADSRVHMESLLAAYPGVQAGWVSADIHLLEPYWGFFPELTDQHRPITGHDR